MKSKRLILLLSIIFWLLILLYILLLPNLTNNQIKNKEKDNDFIKTYYELDYIQNETDFSYKIKGPCNKSNINLFNSHY